MSMGMAMMNSVLSSETALQNVKSMYSQRRLMDSSTGIMESEIKSDKERNVNTKKKEEELASAKEKVNTMTGQIGSALTDVQDKIAEDSEKIREEERIEQERKDKAEQKDKENWESPRDTVEISQEAKAAAARNGSGSSSAGPAQVKSVKPAAGKAAPAPAVTTPAVSVPASSSSR